MRSAWLVATGAVALVLGWGYWHASTHATLRVSARDTALASDGMTWGPVRNADIVFLDAQGQPLASGRIAPPWGLFAARHPQAGDCSAEEAAAAKSASAAQAWHQCFGAQSRWLPQWVPQVRFANVKLPSCLLERVPVEIDRERGEWWLWWVPLPHMGGRPYTSYELTLWVDGRRCTAAAPTSGTA